MKRLIQTALAVTALMPLPAFAGDAALGEAAYGQCKACHSVIAPDGTEILRGGMIGPNLYGLIGRPIASDPDFYDKYSAALLAAGADGSVWDEAAIVAYSADPDGWLAGKTGDPAAKGVMTYASGENVADILAYLVSIGG